MARLDFSDAPALHFILENLIFFVLTATYHRIDFSKAHHSDCRRNSENVEHDEDAVIISVCKRRYLKGLNQHFNSPSVIFLIREPCQSAAGTS